MQRYLYIYHANTYNNEHPFYKLAPVPGSDISEAVLFAGVLGDMTSRRRNTFLYIETNTTIDEANEYLNLRLISQMVQLTTGLPGEATPVDIPANLRGFQDVLKVYGAETYYEPGVSYGGMVNTPDGIAKVQALSHFLTVVNDEDATKFQNALQSFIWAQEAERVNPHLKYTLFMSLYLSSINQLADNPSPVCDSRLSCPDCGEVLNIKHSTSHISEMKSLARRLLTGSGVENAVALLGRLYHELRSNFLHDGLLSGSERQGGFMNGSRHIQLIEDMANVETLNRSLLGLFLQQKAREAIRGQRPTGRGQQRAAR